MSDSEQNTETAFPAMTPGGYCTPGMTKREWMIGQALANPAICHSVLSDIGKAEAAIKVADFVLYILNDPTPDTTTAQQIALGIGGVR